ncbi:Tigger transposable element-derived protein 4 [Araneus ventricosus]|uniref:Tigger transposable element-derived protein 4 n=1 Tax=Araneus ventricosus TaxID=182803 RepID=A0A4Y2X1B8_ARAVE|nr:Tigger transposable element-derived protein 4 [Araneus ventricosus]
MSKRVFLNLEQRIEVLRQYERGKSSRKLAELFNCERTQINKVIKEKDLILKEYEDFKFRGVKRMRHEKYVDINEVVLEWFKTVRAKKIPVSGPMIQHKAKELADTLGIENFSASNGWRDRFRIRNNITFLLLCGEAAYVYPSSFEDWQESLPLFLAEYDEKNIFNMDENGTLFRAFPNKSMIQKSEEGRGGKIPKERLTISFCVSAAGDKEKPLVIWRYQRPRYFKGKDLNLLGVSWAEDQLAEFSKLAGTEYDPESFQHEAAVECFDDYSADWEERLLVNKSAEGTNSVSDEEFADTVCNRQQAKLSTQATLRKIDEVIGNSDAMTNESVRDLLFKLKTELEKKVVSAKSKSLKQSQIVSFFQKM